MTDDPKVTLPVNLGGKAEDGGKGGVLAEATLTFTPGGVYVDVEVEVPQPDGSTLKQVVPTIGFDRSRLSAAVVGRNLCDLFGGAQ